MRGVALRLAVRAPFLVAIATLLVVLAARSSLLVLLPFPRAVVILALALALALALLPALVTARTPLASTLAIGVPLIAAAAYDESRLDWLRLLKDFHVAAPGSPDPLRLALALGVLVLAWALHAVDHAARLRASAVERGIPPLQARAGARLALQHAARVGALALVGALVVGALAWASSFLDATTLLAGRASILAPLLAVALIAVAAVLLVRGADRPRRDS